MPATDESILTEKQQGVLALVREGKSPTEIGRALEITSQAVHGHLRRLRGHGLIPEGSTKPGRAAARARANGVFDPADAIAAVRATIETQRGAINDRQQQIASEIDALKAEGKELTKALAELDKLAPPEPTP